MKLDTASDGLLRGLEAAVSQGETCESAEQSQAATYPLSLQEWHRIVIHAKWSAGSEGFFELYADGSAEPISRVDGPTLYSEISESSSASDTYLKLGIYVSDSLGEAYRPRVYYDLVAFGSSREEVERPAGGESPAPAGDGAESGGFLAALEEIGDVLLSFIERLEAALP